MDSIHTTRTRLLTPFVPHVNPAIGQIVDKQTFWSRVRSGKERVDTLAREVFCQTTLTIKGADDDENEDAMGSDGNVLSSSLEEERSGGPSSQKRLSATEAATAGGGIVRVHSIFETASHLVREEGVTWCLVCFLFVCEGRRPITNCLARVFFFHDGSIPRDDAPIDHVETGKCARECIIFGVGGFYSKKPLLFILFFRCARCALYSLVDAVVKVPVVMLVVLVDRTI